MTITTDLTSQFLGARKVSTPLIALWTADPAAAIEGLAAVLGPETPVLQWDLVRGLIGLNPLGVAAATKLIGQGVDAAAATGVPTDMLRLAMNLPRAAVTFMLNAPRYWEAPDVAQALWNLRDPYKATKRTLVLVGPDGKVPRELEHDLTVLSEPLPSRAELEVIVADLHEAVKLPAPTGAALSLLVDAMSGLSAFAAEQVGALSLTKDGMDLTLLRDRRRQAVENTPGLTIYRGSETFEDLGGLRQIVAFFRRVKAKAKEPIKAIAFIDEIDKSMAGAGSATGGVGDGTGIAQDAHKVLLTGMQDNDSQGAMLYGIPGTGKTAFAKALANELGVELLQWDMGAMQDSLVGKSQANVRAAMKVTNAVGQGQVLYLATCNSTATISTELRRRFRTYGEWFFDLPASDETPQIAAIYLKKYGLVVTKANPLPDLTEWTGAEIKSLCYIAYNLDLPFSEAAQFVVPMVKSAPEVVARLRGQAEGKFLSVSDGGFYSQAENTKAKPKRDITLDDVVEAAAVGVTVGRMKES